MKRVLIAATIAASFITTSLLAAETTAPLAPGKAAGVSKAQDADDTTLYVVGGGALAIGVIVLATDNGSTPVANSSSSTS